jgi:hypothetical protein
MKRIRTCPRCGTACYATRNTARQVARREASEGRLRAWRCPAGLGWHLTPDQPVRRRRRAPRRPPRDSRPIVRQLVAGGRRAAR